MIEIDLKYEAFLKTLYHVEAPEGSFVIRIDTNSLELDAILLAQHLENWAYVTAFNPQGCLALDAHNSEAQHRLECELNERQLLWYAGSTEAEHGDWPPEPSCLILDIDREDAIELGRRYGQAAIVTGFRGAKAELVIIDWPQAPPNS